MRLFLAMGLACMLMTGQACAEEATPSLATAPPADRYNPWIAAGLNYLPVALDSAVVIGAAGLTTESAWKSGALTIAVNPLPGLGHWYVNEPARGTAFFGTGLGLLVAIAGANVLLWQGRRPIDAPAPWQEELRGGLNLAYLGVSSALSFGAAWDAFRLATEKSRTSANSSASP